jgi:hypothetical protein
VINLRQLLDEHLKDENPELHEEFQKTYRKFLQDPNNNTIPVIAMRTEHLKELEKLGLVTFPLHLRQQLMLDEPFSQSKQDDDISLMLINSVIEDQLRKVHSEISDLPPLDLDVLE